MIPTLSNESMVLCPRKASGIFLRVMAVVPWGNFNMASFHSSTDMSLDAMTALSKAGDTESLKPWSTPLVIVSLARDTVAQVTVFTDGTDPTFGGQYGS